MLSVGSVVKLTRGGPEMRIEAINQLWDGSTEAMCCWTDRTKSRPAEHRTWFATKYLEVVPRR